jgi:hypothetical protein
MAIPIAISLNGRDEKGAGVGAGPCSKIISNSQTNLVSSASVGLDLSAGENMPVSTRESNQ